MFMLQKYNTMYLNFSISKDQTNIIKGVAISFIVLHNFLHMLPGTFGENEMTYKPLFLKYAQLVYDSPSTIVRSFFSYFGHYGVQLFIFISGYGVAKSFSKTRQSTACFVLRRLFNIYKLMLITIFTMLLLRAAEVIQPGVIGLFKAMFRHALMINNLSLETMFNYVGPWWFFDIILQLYLIFPIVFYIISRYPKKGFLLLLVCVYSIIYALSPVAEKFSFPLFANFIGHLPEFALGIFLALNSERKISLYWIIVAGVFFCFGTVNSVFFPFTFLAITVLTLAVILLFSRVNCSCIIMFVGRISPYVFVLNGPLRDVLLPAAKTSSDLMQIVYSLLHFIMVIVISAGTHYAAHFAESFLRRRQA